MKIKIVKCFRPTYWYNSHIGETFECVEKNSLKDLQSENFLDTYKVWQDKNTDSRGYVLMTDAVVVEEGVTDALIEQMADDYVNPQHPRDKFKKRYSHARVHYKQGLIDMKNLLIKQ